MDLVKMGYFRETPEYHAPQRHHCISNIVSKAKSIAALAKCKADSFPVTAKSALCQFVTAFLLTFQHS